MLNKNKKFYITTSIVYTNAFPHIGFALESIQADVIARYQRLLGKEVFFLTGTDEHGAKVAKSAEKDRRNPKEFVNEISKKVKNLKQILNLSNDDFIRTTNKTRHWAAVKKVWLKLEKNGDIYKRKYKGLYCRGCEAFITKKDLKNEKCRIHRIKTEVIEEENYFFRLSKYSKKIEEILKKNIIRIIPSGRKNENLSFIKKGLKDISFSRPRKDLKWGIPVQKFWPADVHCIGKDIQKFHCLIWPGMLLSLKLPLPKTIFVHGFITVAGKKMSKSIGNVIDPFKLVKKYGTDTVRYFLLREIPPIEDGDFTYQKFEQRYNADLASGIGNLVSRVLTMAQGLHSTRNIRSSKFQPIITKTWKNYHKNLKEFKFNEALITIWRLINFCDKYIDKERPWEKTKNQKIKIHNLLFILGHIAHMLRPFLPTTSEKIFQQLGVSPEDKKPWRFRVKKGKSLFPRLAS